MRISILQGSVEGTAVYVETQVSTTNSNGLVTIEIGGGTPVTGTFTGIDWSTGPYYIKTETDPAGGVNYPAIVGTSQLLSVPYALYAKNSESATDAVKISGNQTIAGNKTFSGTTKVITPVNATDAVNKAYVDALQSQINMLRNSFIEGGVITDYDNNVYNTIKIGTQVWMSENLKTPKYNDGTTIPLLTDDNAWGALITPGYCWYNNDEARYKAAYGALYNWYIVDAASNGGKNVCPSGWHVPTDGEWTTLENYLIANEYNYDGTTIGNKIAKSLASSIGWTSSTTAGAVGNTDYTAKRNATGFTTLPGGYRNDDGTFNDGGNGGWWSATESVADEARDRYLYYK